MSIYTKPQRNIRERGFTLLELLVAVSLFAIVVGSATDAFVSVIRNYQALTARQNLIENTRFAMEFMSRQIRMAQRAETGACIPSGKTYHYSAPSGNPQITFIDSGGKCVIFQYYESNKNIRMKIDGGNWIDVTSQSMARINGLSFVLSGESDNDNKQPLLTIFMSARGVKDGREAGLTVYFQTTVSNRNIDIP